MKKKKGFTLIELLVVIAIIAMLLAILMPALGKVKKLAMRLVCGTNLKGMANAMNVYAFDYRDEYPIAGGDGDATWNRNFTDGWNNPSKNWTGNSPVSLAASLFMLVREADVGVKSFVCSASDQTPFVNQTDHDVVELWDFGEKGSPPDQFGDFGPEKCQSYSYQNPFKGTGRDGNTKFYPADGTSNPGNAVMADRSPFFDSNLTIVGKADVTGDDWMEKAAKITFGTSDKYLIQVGNSSPHDREGQNVLFNDGHVSFEKSPDVGTRYDNIFTVIGANADMNISRREGTLPGDPPCGESREDSVLIND